MSVAKGAANDVVNLLDQVPEIDARSKEGATVEQKTTRGRIKFEEVHFRYPTRPGTRVLRNLNLVVESGTYVALVGASGCGKSTTVHTASSGLHKLAYCMLTCPRISGLPLPRFVV